MIVNVLFAGIPVTDFAVSRDWYERLLGRPAEILVHDHEDMWQMSEGAWMYVVADADRAGKSLVAMAVSNFDQSITEIEGRGIAVETIEVVGGGRRKATVFDPDHNLVAIIEVLDQG